MAKAAQPEGTDMARTTTMTPTPTVARFLSQLKVSNIKRSAAVNIADPTIRARTKLIEAIQEQIKHVQAEIDGKEYNPTVMKYVTAPDGTRVREEGPKRKLLWWWKQDGKFFSEVRYGSSPVDFGSGSAIECGPQLPDVIEVLDTVVQAIEQGELDSELKKLAARRGRGKAAPETPPASPMERIQRKTTQR